MKLAKWQSSSKSTKPFLEHEIKGRMSIYRLITIVIISIVSLCVLSGCQMIRGDETAKEKNRLQSIKLLNVYISADKKLSIFEFENISDENIAAFKGNFNLYDIFGDPAGGTFFVCTETIPAKSKIHHKIFPHPSLKNHSDVVWAKSLDELEPIKDAYPNGKINPTEWKFECTNLVFEQTEPTKKRIYVDGEWKFATP